MESSDDSFVWMKASSDSESDSDTKSVGKMNNNDSDDVSKSGKKYKKQLQKRLFEGRDSPSGARVKREPPPDQPDQPDQPHQPDQLDPDDSYLALRVKLERAAATHDTTNLSDSSVTHRSKKSKKKKRKRERDDPSDDCDYKNTSSRIEDETHDSASSTPRKKKFKGERCSGDAVSYEMNGMMVEDKFSAEETVVESRPSSEGRRRPHVSNGTETDGRTERRTSKVKPDGVFTSKEFISDESGDDDDDEEESTKSKTVLASRPARRSSTRDGEPLDDRAPAPDVTHRKLSDRIQFEADDTADDTMDVDAGGTAGAGRVRSTKVSRYLSSRGHLRAHEHGHGHRPRAACLLTRDDEAWLLTCPREVDLSALRGTDISLDEDAKCKIKVDGQTYNGSVDDRDARINVLSVERDRTVIVNVPVSGTVRFRKRIPKAHFVEDGHVRNDRTDFIPLPETKCRHPLFGPDYRRAVRVPTSVKDRLNRPDVEEPQVRKKKKHKKERVDLDAPALEPEPEPEPAPEPAAEPRRSKKRKHKHSDADADAEEPSLKKKRVKREPSSAGAGAWDSEKAIEENLFNF